MKLKAISYIEYVLNKGHHNRLIALLNKIKYETDITNLSNMINGVICEAEDISKIIAKRRDAEKKLMEKKEIRRKLIESREAKLKRVLKDDCTEVL